MGDLGPLAYDNDAIVCDDDNVSTATVVAGDSDASDGRVQEILEVIKTGNSYQLDELLREWGEHGRNAATSGRDHRGLSLYVTAIEESFLDAINTLLKHNIPLGDALIRCIDENFEDATYAICRYLASNPEICKDAIDAKCDNDDFHPAITALILAAQRNNFDVVKSLVDLGAKLEVPKMSVGADVTLTQAVSTLHIYRAISQPAYMMATQFDIFAYAFKMSKRLRTLGDTWQDFGAEFGALAESVEEFAADFLGQTASTEEVLALLRYHKTDKYRDREGRQHPLAKVSEAIHYKQKNFIAHPHSQKVLISHFFRSLLSWNAKGAIHRIFLALLVTVCYPLICIAYILFPIPPIIRFVRIPYVMMLLKLGSGLTFIGLIIFLGVVHRASNPELTQGLIFLILIWNVGVFWLHMKMIWKQGGKRFVNYFSNIQEAVIVALYITIFFLQWDWHIDVRPNIPNTNRLRRAADTDQLSDANALNFQQRVTTVLGGFGQNLTDPARHNISSALLKALSDENCRYGDSALPSTEATLSLNSLPEYYRIHLAADAYDPVLVSEALYGVAMMITILRLTNLLVVSESLGPLRISLGSMGPDFIKFFGIFFIVWFAFGVGMTQNYFSAARAERQDCLQNGGEEESCYADSNYAAFPDTLVELYWTLFGFTELDTLRVSPQHLIAQLIGTILYAMYMVIGVLILLNALIGMLSSTYNAVEEDADTEWKFHRAVVWDIYLHPVGTLPPPFNLIPSIKSLWRCLRSFVGIWIKCARRTHANKKHIHAKQELQDYIRVIKLISSRYIQQNLTGESQSADGASPKDLKQLKNDLLSLRYFTQNRLRKFNKNLLGTGEKCDQVHLKLNDLVPTYVRTEDLNVQSSELTDQTEELKEKINSLNFEIDRLQKLLAQKDKGKPGVEPGVKPGVEPELEPGVEPELELGVEPVQESEPTLEDRSVPDELEPDLEPDLEPKEVRADRSDSLIRRLVTRMEQDKLWGDDFEIQQELARASRRAGHGSHHKPPSARGNSPGPSPGPSPRP